MKVPTAEEREIAARESQDRAFAADDAERDRLSKKALTITLVHEPEMRTRPSGERIVLLRGTEQGQSKPLSAVYAVPPRAEQREADAAAFDGLMRDLGGGDRLTIAGQWSKRGWKDQQGVSQTAWEFKTQHFARGEMSLEQVLEKARVDRGEAPSRGQPEADVVREGKRPQVARAAAGRDGGMGV